MGAMRSSYTSAEDGLLMVFSNGTMLEYPRFVRASNGFVRGPKGEQCGRGDKGTEMAKQLCLEHINRYIEQFQKFGHKMVGITAPLDLKMRWNSMREYQWLETEPTPGDIHITAKCYWQDNPDTWEINRWERYAYSSWARITHAKITTPFRRSNSYDDNGLLKKYWEQDNLIAFRSTPIGTDRQPSLRDSINMLKEDVQTFIDTNDYVRVEWKVENIDNLLGRLHKAYEAKEVIERVADLLPEIARFYQELGFKVEALSEFGNEGPVSYLQIEADEHIVRLMPDSARTICKLERDEERLSNIHKMRLAEELRASLETHGDIRNADLE